jgi:hypothetical protein
LKVQKEDIESRLDKRRKDTFWGHFLTFFSFEEIFADVEKDRISVWRKRIKGGVLYPVFIFEFNSDDELIRVREKLNDLGRLNYFLIPLTFSFSFWNFLFDDFDIDKLIFTIGAMIAFTVLWFFVSRLFYRFEKSEAKEYYFELFEIEEDSEEREFEKEWSFKNTVFRVFIYLFCLLIISIGIGVIFGTIRGEVSLDGLLGGVLGLGIALVYIGSDLKILFGRRK